MELAGLGWLDLEVASVPPLSGIRYPVSGNLRSDPPEPGRAMLNPLLHIHRTPPLLAGQVADAQASIVRGIGECNLSDVSTTQILRNFLYSHLNFYASLDF